MLRILVPLDGARAAEEALKHAVAIARTFPAEVTLLRVITDSESGDTVRKDSVDVALWHRQAQAYLNALIEIHARPEMIIQCKVAEGNPAETIVRYVGSEKTDLLILTRYGRGQAENFSVGGTAQKVVSSVDCSVLLLDPRRQCDPENQYHRILVPVDSSKSSDCAVAVASMIAEIHEASLLLLHITDELRFPENTPATQHVQSLMREIQRITRFESERRLNELAAMVPKHIPVERRAFVSSDTPFAIESMAEEHDSDLMLLHTVDTRAETHRGFGATNRSLIQYSHRPLFILKPSAGEGFANSFRSVYLDEPQLEAS